MLQFLAKARNWWFHHVGRRGSALLFFAFLDLVYGWSLLTLPEEAQESPAFEYINQVVPIEAWALGWILVGLVCLVSAFVRSDFIAFTCAIVIKILWGIVYISGDVAGEINRGYVAAAIWFALALLVKLISGWPEVPGGDKWTIPASSSQDSP